MQSNSYRAFNRVAYLCKADHKQILGLLVIKLGQVAEQSGKTGIVCPRTDQAHGKDGIPGDGRVCIVRELGECVQNAELGVGGRDEGQG